MGLGSVGVRPPEIFLKQHDFRKCDSSRKAARHLKGREGSRSGDQDYSNLRAEEGRKRQE